MSEEKLRAENERLHLILDAFFPTLTRLASMACEARPDMKDDVMELVEKMEKDYGSGPFADREDAPQVAAPSEAAY